MQWVVPGESAYGNMPFRFRLGCHRDQILNPSQNPRAGAGHDAHKREAQMEWLTALGSMYATFIKVLTPAIDYNAWLPGKDEAMQTLRGEKVRI